MTEYETFLTEYCNQSHNAMHIAEDMILFVSIHTYKDFLVTHVSFDKSGAKVHYKREGCCGDHDEYDYIEVPRKVLEGDSSWMFNAVRRMKEAEELKEHNIRRARFNQLSKQLQAYDALNIEQLKQDRAEFAELSKQFTDAKCLLP